MPGLRFTLINLFFFLFFLLSPSFARERDIVLENKELRVSIEPSLGGRIKSFIYKPTGKELTWWGIPEGNREGGLCQDNFFGLPKSGEASVKGYRATYITPYKWEIIKEGSSIKLWQEIKLKELKGVIITKIFRLYEGLPYLEVKLAINNRSEQARKISPWVHNAVIAGGSLDNSDYYFVPTKKGIYAQRFEFFRNKVNTYIRDFTEGWIGLIDTQQKEGLIALVDPSQLHQFYFWISQEGKYSTMEWMYKEIELRPGETWNTTYYLIPLEGIGGCIYADRNLIVDITPKDLKEDTYHILTLTSFADLGKSTIRLTYDREGKTPIAEIKNITLNKGEVEKIRIPKGEISRIKVIIKGVKKIAEFSYKGTIYGELLPELPSPQKIKRYSQLEKVFPFGLVVSSHSLLRRKRYFEEDPVKRFNLWVKDAKRHYINLLLIMGNYYVAEDKERAKEIFRIAGRHNIYIFQQLHVGPIDPKKALTYNEKEIIENFEKMAKPILHEPALLCWNMWDEPWVKHLNLFLKRRKKIEELDPFHAPLPIICYRSSLKAFAPYLPVLVTDKYPIFKGDRNPWIINQWIAEARKVARGPVWFVQQAHDGRMYSYPTVSEFRLMTYLALAQGAKGIIYYEYGNDVPYWLIPHYPGLTDSWGNSISLWEEVRRIGRFISVIGPLLLKTEVVESPSFIHVDSKSIRAYNSTIKAIQVGVLKEEDKDRYFLLILNNDVNNPQEGKIAIDFPFIKDKELFNLYTLSPVSLSKETSRVSFNISLLPGDGIMYLLSSPRDYIDIAKEINKNRFIKEKEIFEMDYSQIQRVNLLTPELQKLFARANLNYKKGEYRRALILLDKCRDLLIRIMEGNSEYRDCKILFDNIGSIFLRIDKMLIDHLYLVTDRWRNLPYGVDIQFTAGKPMQEYLDKVIVLGKNYLRLKEAFYRGEMTDILPRVRVLKKEVEELAEKIDHFIQRGKQKRKDKGEVLYLDNFEEGSEWKFWTSNGECEVNYIGISNEEVHSGKRSLKIDVTLHSGDYCFFSVPVKVKLKADSKYYLSGYLLPVQLPIGTNVSLGWSVLYTSPDGTVWQGNRVIRPSITNPQKDWLKKEIEVYKDAKESAKSYKKWVEGTEMIMDRIYVGIGGGKFKGQRVILYLDDVEFIKE